MEHSPELG